MTLFSHRRHSQAGTGTGTEATPPKTSGRKLLEAIPRWRSRSPSPSPSRSPSPLPAVSQIQRSNEAAFAANRLSVPPVLSPGVSLGPSILPVQEEANPTQSHEENPKLTVTPTEPPSNDDGKLDSGETDSSKPDETISDIPGSAYRKAWSSLTEDQRKELTSQDGIRELFIQLNKTDEQHKSQSLLRKGLSAVSPYLTRLQVTIDFVSPFASVEPAAGTALGLIKGVTSVAIGICGAADDLTSRIGSFLEHIPAIDRCSEVVKDGGPMPDIHKALVNVYSDLLNFYLKTIVLFKKSKFVLHMAMSLLKPELPKIIDSFNDHSKVLSRLLESETFASVQEVKNEQADTLIRDTLDSHRGAEIAYQNVLRRRADEACSWITSSEEFTYWLLNSHDSNLLAMFGDMGRGKTMTTAFLVDHLLSQKRPVCAYYCKDDETTELGNIYRSLIWQLLKRQPELKARFLAWYKKTEPLGVVNPTQNNDQLHGFLYDAISSSKDWIFVVLDGLDECKPGPQNGLFKLLNELLDHRARVKIFISSRYDDLIERSLPSSATRIQVGSSSEQDRIIANYLAGQLNISEKIREEVVGDLSRKADGSAIWLRIALEYIGQLHIKNQKAFQKALQNLPSSQGLSELYWKLFVGTCSNIPQNEDLVQRALETLAVARRPLSSKELAYAIYIDAEDEDIENIPELAELAESVDLLELIRPFISTINVESRKDPQLRLVHQSLKELVLQAPPASWETIGKTRGGSQKVQRWGELNGALLGRCIKYLRFDECEENAIFPSFENGADDLEFLAIGGVLEDDESLNMQTDSGPVGDFNPAEQGLGELFAYAAANWTTHLSDTPQALRPDSADMIVLSRAGSQRLENWAEQWRRPNCSYIPEYGFPEAMSDLDPLVVTAIFGSQASMADILKCDLQTPDFLPGSVWIAVKQLVKRGEVATLEGLLKDRTFGSTLCTVAFFYEVVPGWSSPHRERGRTAKEWENIFAFLIAELRDKLLDYHGTEVLCLAARGGCFVLVKKLFEAADQDPELRRSILTEHRQKLDGREKLLSTHQSVGEAAFEGNVEVVRFLCEQPGIEGHLHHINHRRRTVFHQAARFGSTEIFQILIQRWPEGINLRNSENDTPLHELIFGSPAGNIRTTKTVEAILATGKVDATGLTDDVGFSPLCTAIRGANIDLCRVLIRKGSADMSCAVWIEEETGRPILAPNVNTRESTEEKDTMLKALCSLLPLAVSTDYLF